ncbi:cation-transporting P-type ATPase [Microvirga sp. Mcv34]|uniref:cation-transporting P-type ATPase n=1 Tax=Microvirga sp. Mcv34 TaxID=2926016 RepID=UPI002905E49B|nr:cation-transporting P-type ATPase [Microvirga sp. Mcv34]
MMMEQHEKAWHSRTAGEVLEDLGSSNDGLSASEAARRLSTHGLNELPATAGRPALLRFLAQFNNVLIYFLLVAAVAAAVLGHVVDAAVIAAVVIVNAIIGFIQEGKAEKALNAIRSMIAPMPSSCATGSARRSRCGISCPGTSCSLRPATRSRRTCACCARAACSSTRLSSPASR